MSRMVLLNGINYWLSVLKYETENASGSNMQDINLVSEDFYCELFNVIFDYSLVNANQFRSNFPGVDLIDDKNKVLIQVSSTCTSDKIRHSLEEIEKNINRFDGYKFKFISLTKDIDKLKHGKYSVKGNISFTPSTDIYDKKSIYAKIKVLSTEKISSIYSLCKNNIKFNPNPVKLESGLVYIINALSSVPLYEKNVNIETVAFDINAKIIKNDIELFRDIINDNVVYYNTIKQIYEEYDKIGQNKSLAVLYSLHKKYLEATKHKYHGDDIYAYINEKVKQEVMENADIIQSNLDQESLSFYIDLILIHAFIECQIYQKP